MYVYLHISNLHNLDSTLWGLGGFGVASVMVSLADLVKLLISLTLSFFTVKLVP